MKHVLIVLFVFLVIISSVSAQVIAQEENWFTKIIKAFTGHSEKKITLPDNTNAGSQIVDPTSTSNNETTNIVVDAYTAQIINDKATQRVRTMEQASTKVCAQLRTQVYNCGYADEFEAQCTTRLDELEAQCDSELTYCLDNAMENEEQAYQDGFNDGKDSLRNSLSDTYSMRYSNVFATCQQQCTTLYDDNWQTYECGLAIDKDGNVKSCYDSLASEATCYCIVS